MNIWKYELKIADEQVVDMPRGANILSCHQQWESICLWAMVDSNAPTVPRTFRVFGTGRPVANPEMLTFLGTVQVMGGSLVFHVFEQKAA